MSVQLHSVIIFFTVLNLNFHNHTKIQYYFRFKSNYNITVEIDLPNSRFPEDIWSDSKGIACPVFNVPFLEDVPNPRG